MATGSRSEVLQGTLDLLVLEVLAGADAWLGTPFRLRTMSNDVFEVNQGSLYPALQRMLRRGWVRSEWRATENNRQARYYAITREGERQLAAQQAECERSSGAVNRVLRFAFQGA